MTTKRRDFLRGLGASIALPSLESVCAKPVVEMSRLATTATGKPLRMAYLYVPNGVHVEKWKSGETLQTLQPLSQYFSVLEGLEVEKATSGGDGAGDHARGNAAFLTGVRPRKTSGSDISLGQSVDQFVADQLGDLTRFRSLELGTSAVRRSGNCDSGYSCAYQFNLSWRSETQPMSPESNPRLLFERLFGAGTGKQRKESFERRREERLSVIDFVQEDAKRLQKTLSAGDKTKVDEYLTGLRELERRIELAERWEIPEPGDFKSPKGVPKSYEEHLRLMMDLLLVAFETDQTRVATFSLAHEGSNRSFDEIGVSEGHHTLSHHDKQADRLEKIAKIDSFYTQQLAYFLEQAAAKKDAEGESLLDNSMFLYGSAISDGNRHSHRDLPVLLAGGGGGAFESGRHIKLPHDVPITNLYLRMAQEMGIHAERFGDSTGVLKAV